MINQKIRIEETEVHDLAEKRFIQTCGFDLTSEVHRRMMGMGRKVREDGIEGIDIRALVSFCGPEHFSGGAVRAGGAVIACRYFDQIPPEAVEGICFYMLTAGECLFSSEENAMDVLYADIWGTSYIDAGIQVLTEQHIRRSLAKRFPGRMVCLSEGFGPGYFGMPVTETKKFFSVLDAPSIGVQLGESGVMIPQKTCTGLYLIYNREDIKAEPGCMECLGNADGCQFCALKTGIKEEG